MAQVRREFRVVDRPSGDILAVRLTATEVVDRYVAAGERSASLALMRHADIGKWLSLGPHVRVVRTL